MKTKTIGWSPFLWVFPYDTQELKFYFAIRSLHQRLVVSFLWRWWEEWPEEWPEECIVVCLPLCLETSTSKESEQWILMAFFLEQLSRNRESSNTTFYSFSYPCSHASSTVPCLIFNTYVLKVCSFKTPTNKDIVLILQEMRIFLGAVLNKRLQR